MAKRAVVEKEGEEVKEYEKIFRLKDYGNGMREFGNCFWFNESWYIVFAYEDVSKQRRKFSVAHELGHILLGHRHYETDYTEKNTPEDELEADYFAIVLLTPACVLHGIGVDSHYEISNLCGISQEIAIERYKELKQLQKDKRIFTSTIERLVYNKFSGFITNYKNPPIK
ncbi:MAG: ImmA/IrrE family metallo-endopeptidase [Oscillospiraceae bacterium]|nr:ImmA/IrrE family metallo-endopeptidase [Oscillospiraceae bacterium]